MNFSEITQVKNEGKYQINVGWYELIDQMSSLNFTLKQQIIRREIEWTDEKQICYIETRLRGVPLGRDIQLSKPLRTNPIILIDGGQRLLSVLRFLSDEITPFGSKFSQFTDPLPLTVDFVFHINKMPHYADAQEMYRILNEVK